MSTLKPRLLLVDDDEVFRERLAKAFRKRDIDVDTADGPSAALMLAKHTIFDMAVVDLRMPTGSGMDVVKELAETQPNVRILVLTGYGSIPTAVEATRLGAAAYLAKPADADDILRSFDRAPEGPISPAEQLEDADGTPSLARVEWEHINRVLADCDNNLSEAARRLGIHRRSLQRKMQKYPPKR
jgi:two-component system, response regulator RegA